MNKKFSTTKLQLTSKNWRVIIPNLTDYTRLSLKQLMNLKLLILERLKYRPQTKGSNIKSEFSRGLKYYRIALERHANGVPHLDILLVYATSICRRATDFDFLYKHGDVTTYRNLNRAIIEYGTKEDKQNLHNFPEDVSGILQIQDLKKDPYRYLELEMLKDPLHFNLDQYVRKNDLFQYISGWSSLKSKLKDSQTAAANILLQQKPGFKYITRQLIESQLTPTQLQTYDSWSGYQTIVNKLNEILTHRWNRPFKTKQLMLVGRPDIGKTTLVNELEKHSATYHMNVSNWFPKYRDHVYTLISWNQFKLKGGMSHTELLKFLEGYPMDLQYKGGSSLRRDNQLIIMTSNMTLDQHIKLKFKDKQQRQLATANLKARIEELIVPLKMDLFLLLKLLLF